MTFSTPVAHGVRGLRIHIFDDDGVQTGVLADPVPANSSINVEGVWSTSMAEGYDLRAKASVSNVRDTAVCGGTGQCRCSQHQARASGNEESLGGRHSARLRLS
ncbi:MAG: hypothetical protein R3C68_18685 [Myxococcota bacterium]